MVVFIPLIVLPVMNSIKENKYRELEREVLRELGFSSWSSVPYFDDYVIVKSRQALEKYDDIKFFKENPEKLLKAKNIIADKYETARELRVFLDNNQ